MLDRDSLGGGDSYAVVELSGDGRSRGGTHGEQLRDQIGSAMERWRSRIGTLTGLDPGAYVERFLNASSLVATVESQSPDLHDEVLAIAAASNQPVADILAYNFMDEEWRYARTTSVGCSVIGVAGEDDTLLGQNMDLPESMYGSQAILRIAGNDDPDVIVATAAGMIGLLGVNRAGVACCVNTLSQLPNALAGMPVSFVLREVLRRRTRASAGEYLRATSHASGQHYAVADPHGVDGYECSTAGVYPRPVSDRVLVHTNHPLWVPGSDQLRPTPEELERTGSRARWNFLSVAVPMLGSAQEVIEILGSTESGICVSPRPPKNSRTFCSAVFELGDEDPRAHIALGSPDVTEWEHVGWE